MKVVKATLTNDMQTAAQVALSDRVIQLQKNAIDAKGLGLWDNERYFSEQAVIAQAAYIAILKAE